MERPSACGSLARFVTAYASTGGGGHLTSHERTFLAIALTPKATVQAALRRVLLYSHWSPYDRVGAVNADP